MRAQRNKTTARLLLDKKSHSSPDSITRKNTRTESGKQELDYENNLRHVTVMAQAEQEQRTTARFHVEAHSQSYYWEFTQTFTVRNYISISSLSLSSLSDSTIETLFF